jgi:hypothetical protein
MRKRILVVCMFDAVHAGRWLEQFKDEEIDFVLFPSSPHRRVHSKIRTLIGSSGPATYKLAPGSKIFGLPLWFLDKILANWVRGFILQRVGEGFSPHIVHALELTNAGYVALRAFSKAEKRFKLISTNWGSDIHWFSRFPKHRKRLTELLRISDAYSCECHRDVELAKDLGFSGEVLPVIPNAGGFSHLGSSLTPIENRKLILVKGYQNWAGRANVAISALSQLKQELDGYRVVVFSANLSTIFFAMRKLGSLGENLVIHRKFSLSHEKVLALFSRARIYVGLSVTDGISTSMLEAMAMGAIPVQTSTSCCDEWFSDSGVAVREISVEAVRDGIVRALELAEDPMNAARNLDTIRLNADAGKVSLVARTFYNI